MGVTVLSELGDCLLHIQCVGGVGIALGDAMAGVMLMKAQLMSVVR